MVEVDVNTLRNNKKLCGASWKKFGKVKSQDVLKVAIKVGTAPAVLEKFQEIQNPLENSREKKLLNIQSDHHRKTASTASPALFSTRPALQSALLSLLLLPYNTLAPIHKNTMSPSANPYHQSLPPYNTILHSSAIVLFCA